MPTCFESPAREDMSRYREYLEGLGLDAKARDHFLGPAYHFIRHRDDLPPAERLRSWMHELATTGPSGRACRLICKTLRFFDFCGNPALRQILNQVRSCAALVRALAQTNTWEQALYLARRPSFESDLASWLQAFLDYWTGRQMKLDHWPYELRRLDRLALESGVRSPEQLTPELLERFLSANRPSPRYRNARLSRLRGLQRFLESRGVGFHIPPGLSVPEPLFHPHLYTLNEISQVLRAFRRRGARGQKYRWLAIETIVFLLYACGMRLREPLHLRVCDVDLKGATLFLHCTKFYKQRWVPLGKAAVRRLKSYQRLRQATFPTRTAPDDPLFLTPQGRCFSNGVLESAFASVIHELGVMSRGTRRPRLHDLRHTLAVHRMYKWYSEGHDVQNKLPLLSAYLGHDQLHDTEVYLHLTEDLIRLAGCNFQRSFEEVVGKRI
jgi:integrase/recombinase XerD